MVITNDDLQEILEEISNPGNRKIDFAMFGCPHFTLDQAMHIAERIDGKKLAVPMWILTSYHVKELADRMDITEKIEKAGAFIVPDTCPGSALLAWPERQDRRNGISEMCLLPEAPWNRICNP